MTGWADLPETLPLTVAASFLVVLCLVAAVSGRAPLTRIGMAMLRRLARRRRIGRGFIVGWCRLRAALRWWRGRPYRLRDVPGWGVATLERLAAEPDVAPGQASALARALFDAYAPKPVGATRPCELSPDCAAAALHWWTEAIRHGHPPWSTVALLERAPAGYGERGVDALMARALLTDDPLAQARAGDWFAGLLGGLAAVPSEDRTSYLRRLPPLVRFHASREDWHAIGAVWEAAVEAGALVHAPPELCRIVAQACTALAAECSPEQGDLAAHYRSVGWSASTIAEDLDSGESPLSDRLRRWRPTLPGALVAGSIALGVALLTASVLVVAAWRAISAGDAWIEVERPRGCGWLDVETLGLGATHQHVWVVLRDGLARMDGTGRHAECWQTDGESLQEQLGSGETVVQVAGGARGAIAVTSLGRLAEVTPDDSGGATVRWLLGRRLGTWDATRGTEIATATGQGVLAMTDGHQLWRYELAQSAWMETSPLPGTPGEAGAPAARAIAVEKGPRARVWIAFAGRLWVTDGRGAPLLRRLPLQGVTIHELAGTDGGVVALVGGLCPGAQNRGVVELRLADERVALGRTWIGGCASGGPSLFALTDLVDHGHALEALATDGVWWYDHATRRWRPPEDSEAHVAKRWRVGRSADGTWLESADKGAWTRLRLMTSEERAVWEWSGLVTAGPLVSGKHITWHGVEAADPLSPGGETRSRTYLASATVPPAALHGAHAIDLPKMPKGATWVAGGDRLLCAVHLSARWPWCVDLYSGRAMPIGEPLSTGWSREIKLVGAMGSATVAAHGGTGLATISPSGDRLWRAQASRPVASEATLLASIDKARSLVTQGGELAVIGPEKTHALVPERHSTTKRLSGRLRIRSVVSRLANLYVLSDEVRPRVYKWNSYRRRLKELASPFTSKPIVGIGTLGFKVVAVTRDGELLMTDYNRLKAWKRAGTTSVDAVAFGRSEMWVWGQRKLVRVTTDGPQESVAAPAPRQVAGREDYAIWTTREGALHAHGRRIDATGVRRLACAPAGPCHVLRDGLIERMALQGPSMLRLEPLLVPRRPVLDLAYQGEALVVIAGDETGARWRCELIDGGWDACAPWHSETVEPWQRITSPLWSWKRTWRGRNATDSEIALNGEPVTSSGGRLSIDLFEQDPGSIGLAAGILWVRREGGLVLYSQGTGHTTMRPLSSTVSPTQVPPRLGLGSDGRPALYALEAGRWVAYRDTGSFLGRPQALSDQPPRHPPLTAADSAVLMPLGPLQVDVPDVDGPRLLIDEGGTLPRTVRLRARLATSPTLVPVGADARGLWFMDTTGAKWHLPAELECGWACMREWTDEAEPAPEGRRWQVAAPGGGRLECERPLHGGLMTCFVTRPGRERQALAPDSVAADLGGISLGPGRPGGPAWSVVSKDGRTLEPGKRGMVARAARGTDARDGPWTVVAGKDDGELRMARAELEDRLRPSGAGWAFGRDHALGAAVAGGQRVALVTLGDGRSALRTFSGGGAPDTIAALRASTSAITSAGEGVAVETSGRIVVLEASLDWRRGAFPRPKAAGDEPTALTGDGRGGVSMRRGLGAWSVGPVQWSSASGGETGARAPVEEITLDCSLAQRLADVADVCPGGTDGTLTMVLPGRASAGGAPAEWRGWRYGTRPNGAFCLDVLVTCRLTSALDDNAEGRVAVRASKGGSFELRSVSPLGDGRGLIPLGWAVADVSIRKAGEEDHGPLVALYPAATVFGKPGCGDALSAAGSAHDDARVWAVEVRSAAGCVGQGIRLRPAWIPVPDHPSFHMRLGAAIGRANGGPAALRVVDGRLEGLHQVPFPPGRVTGLAATPGGLMTLTKDGLYVFPADRAATLRRVR